VLADARLSKVVFGKSVGLAILVIGLAIGAGLVFTINYAYDVLTPRTITTTWTLTSFVVITIPGTITSTSSTAQIESGVTSCGWSGSSEYCEVSLSNTGTLVTATTGNCNMTYEGQTYRGYTGPTPGSASSPGAPQQLIPGKSVTTYCQASNGGKPVAGTQVTGTVFLADGGEAAFSGVAS
jgi:hypothetical protein